ncbi:adenylate/guanylate cyclase domain-containing protein [Corallococcus sp. AB049A]|uniref:adenylate/guanylate cyclase domain-containing protein n=1 Tax=Corallococcus sp. AB049A TaxID=2316721 RepID=UPI000ED84CBB|nr:adenylate/guanylate cyclase domain-containing protein [Corallococcus sp. AB049A]RKI56901.1 adenylate/guanylate cyclase domain-containing protein [Corallococcus sp. AB049A]
MTKLQTLKQIVADSLNTAQQAAGKMRLDESTRVKIAKSMLTHINGLDSLGLGSGRNLWATSLFVDMRGSTKRALSLGAKKTYLTMHALLPVFSHLVEEQEGFIVGFRGDGLFAVFGINEDGGNPLPLNKHKHVREAAICGAQMIEATYAAINPALETLDIEPINGIGVGVDEGDIIITRIGLGSMYDLTAYGDSVNNASKLCSDSFNEVILSNSAEDLFPSGINGQVTTTPHSGKTQGMVMNFPMSLLD